MRAALPSSLVGLVTFSFVTLAFGSAVYLAALPSLVEASPVVAQVADAVADKRDASQPEPVADMTDSPDAEASPLDETTPGDAGSLPGGGSDDVTTDAVTTAAELPALAGASATPSLSSTAAATNATEDDEPQATDATKDTPQEQPAKGDDQPTTDAQAGATDPSKSAGQQGTSQGSASQGSKSTQPDASRDQEAHDYLVQKASDTNALIAELASLNQEASNNWLADKDTRRDCEDRVSAFVGRTQVAFVSVTRAGYSNTSYASQYNHVIAMYRCISEAAGILDAGWKENLAHRDASADQAELTHLYDSTMATEQKKLDEYNGHAAQLSF